jgi:hypothetical protein
MAPDPAVNTAVSDGMPPLTARQPVLRDEASPTTYSPPDPVPNTVVSDGMGGIVVQLGTTNAADTPEVILEGIRRHEQQHIQDLLASNPRAAEGVPAGNIITWTNERVRDLWQSEVNSSNVEIEYLRGAYPAATDPAIREAINARITQMEGYRAKFQRKLDS